MRNGGAEAYLADASSPGVEIVLAEISSPWAYDATGAAVPTWFDVDGSTLVQGISPTDSTVYPVLVDPYVYTALSHPQVRWSWTETAQLNANKGNFAWVVASCSAVGGLLGLAGGPVGAGVGALFTGVACGAQYTYWANGIGNAYAAGRCFAVNVTWTATPTSYSCRKS